MKFKILALLFFLPLTVRAEEFSKYDENNRQVITNAASLARIKDDDYILSANINLSDSWIPISFSGTLDGAGFTISGLTDSLFKSAENAEIRNLTIKNSAIEAGGNYTGILAAEINSSEVKNIRIIGGEIIANAKENGAVGGLVGKASDSKFENVSVINIKIKCEKNGASRAVGGFAGEIDGGEFISSGADFVTIRGANFAGGFVGHVKENARFVNCHVTAQLYGSGTIGGFAGRVSGAKTSLVGAEFSNCRSFGNITGTGTAGGFAGKLAGHSRVTNSHAYVNISSKNSGGFVGEITNASRIEYSYSHGAVYGRKTAGGFCAIISAANAPNTITSCYALGKIVCGGEKTFRFAAVTEHDGINGCYSYLGMAVISNGVLNHVISNPYGKDGQDIN